MADELGERRFLESVPVSLTGVSGTSDWDEGGDGDRGGDSDVDRTRFAGKVPPTVSSRRGGTNGVALTGVCHRGGVKSCCCCCLPPSCFLALLGEHALGSSAPRTRRLTGDDASIIAGRSRDRDERGSERTDFAFRVRE